MLKQLVKNIKNFNDYVFGGESFYGQQETVEDIEALRRRPHNSARATEVVNSLVTKAAAVYGNCIEKCGNAPMQTIIVEETISSGDIDPLEMTITPHSIHSPILEVREIYADFSDDGSEVIVTGVFNPLSPNFPH